MKRTVWLWQLFGFAAASLGGTLLHFLYDLTGKARWAALFSSVNESTFEHMKLLFWPMLLYAVVQSFFFKDYGNFWCVKLRGAILGIGLIPVLFYTYNGAFGKSPDWLNIAIFFISGAIAYSYEKRSLKEGDSSCSAPAAITALGIIAILFALFTFLTPNLPLFIDPVSGSYGI